MKSIIKYLLLSMLMIACAPPKYYQQTINDLPRVSSTFRAGVFFKGEEVGKEPYLEVIDYDNVVRGRLNSEQIRSFLQKEGELEGVDLFIDVRYSYAIKQTTTWYTLLVDLIDYENPEPYQANIYYTRIRGKGVVFLRNLDFIGNLPEYEYFYLIDRNTSLPQPFFNIEYKLTGQIFKVYPSSQEALEIFRKYFKFYTDYHLTRQRERWVYKRNKDGKITKRLWQRADGKTIRRCFYTYRDNGKLESIRIVNNHLAATEFVRYSYDEQDRLISRDIELYDGARVQEEYQYEGALLTGRRIDIHRPGKEPLELSTSVLYYDPDYLKDFYNNQYFTRKEQ